jgi:hypothetical protein
LNRKIEKNGKFFPAFPVFLFQAPARADFDICSQTLTNQGL